MFVIFYSLTTFTTFVLTFLNIKWVQEISLYFKSILYNYYINKNWLCSTNSSTNLIAKINNDSDRLTNQLILPIIEFFSGFILLTFMFLMVLIVDFKVGFFFFILLLFYLFFYILFKKKLRNAGDDFTKLYPQYYKTLSEGFSSIKDTILFNRKFYFTSRFIKILNRMKKNAIIQSYLTQIPRGLIEILFFILILSFMYLLITKYEYTYVEVTSLIGFYLIVSLKAIPTMQKIYRNFSSIKANISAFDRIEIDLNNAKKLFESADKDLGGDKIELQNQIKFNKINFNYPGNKTNGIFDVNIKIPFGSKVGIAGKTGSGKSTLIDILLGFLKSNSGEIIIGEKILNDKNLKSWQSKISYVPQSFLYPKQTSRQILLLVKKRKLLI